jgi:hypothetical protein
VQANNTVGQNMIIAGIVILIVLIAIALKSSETQFSATHADVAKEIENFINGTGKEHDWDDFLHWSISDPFLEKVRKKCEDVYDEYPATEKGHYCSSEGLEVLRMLLDEVKRKSEPLE